MAADPAWLQITVGTNRSALAEAVLDSHAPQAVSVLDAGREITVEDAPHAQPGFAAARVVGLFPCSTDPDPIVAAIRAALGADVAIAVERLENQDWANSWRAGHPPLRFGARLWVAPHDTPLDAADDAAVVRLDPGLAFGTGTHATTALCLEWLARADLTGRRVLDYGCGSGILAIAAARLGAATVTAVDIDAQALRATRENADRNGVGERIHTPAIDAIDAPPFDIVLANILARPLIALAPRLGTLAAAGAPLILSGLLSRQVEEVTGAYAECFTFAQPAIQDDWARLDGQRRAR